jgi:hypothetical protein
LSPWWGKVLHLPATGASSLAKREGNLRPCLDGAEGARARARIAALIDPGATGAVADRRAARCREHCLGRSTPEDTQAFIVNSENVDRFRPRAATVQPFSNYTVIVAGRM